MSEWLIAAPEQALLSAACHALLLHHVKKDWNATRVDRMLAVLRATFSQHPALSEKLLATGDAVLVEVSTTDGFWGLGKSGTGQNVLGQLLAHVRSELRAEPQISQTIIVTAPVDWCSNSYPCHFDFDGKSFQSAEAAYQYGKPRNAQVTKSLIEAPEPDLISEAADSLLTRHVQSGWSKAARINRLVALALCLFGFGAVPAGAESTSTPTVPSGTTGQENPLEKATRPIKEAESGSVDRARDTCAMAETLKQRGDPKADAIYREAVRIDPSNAECRLLYGDYLRNYRGPEEALVGAAAEQYYAGLLTADESVASQIRRSLIALYERDGLSLADSIDQRRPRFFFSTQNLGARAPEDPGTVDLIRTLVAGDLLAQSDKKTNQPLTLPELDALVRNTWRGALLQRLRIRFSETNVDAYFEGHGGSGSQVADYRDVFSSANVTVGLGGIGVEQVMDLYPAFDLMVRGDIKWGSRYGLVESAPDAHESVRSIVGRAVASRFVGPDKINFEFTVGHDEITQHVPHPIERALDAVGVTARYQFFRSWLGSTPHQRPIASRGTEFFVGMTNQTEAFGAVDVARRDLFAGGSLKGLPGGGNHSFDVTVQPTFFRFNRTARTSDAGKVDPFVNEQLETFVTVLYRLVDRENERRLDALAPLVFLNIVGLFSAGTARAGPDAFDRTRMGAELDAKLVGRQQGGVTWLASGRYERQRFTHLGRTADVFSLSLSMGF